VFFVQVVSIHSVSFLAYGVDAWWSISLPYFIAFTLSLLRTVNEQKVNCWYFALC